MIKIDKDELDFGKFILTDWGNAEVRVAVHKNEMVYFPVKALCFIMQIQPTRQVSRLQEDPAFDDFIAMLPLPTARGARDTLCISIEALPYWITLISRVRAELQENLTLLRKRLMREAFRVMFSDLINASGGVPTLPAAGDTERYVKYLAHRLGKVEDKVFVPDAEDEPVDVVGDLEMRCTNCGYRMHVQLHHSNIMPQPGSSGPKLTVVRKKEEG